MADGTIVIDTTITDEGFVAGTKEMETATRRMAESVSGIGEMGLMPELMR